MSAVVSLGDATLVNFDDPNLLWAAIWIVFNPTMWNIVAQVQYRTGFLSSVFGAKGGCYLLAFTIFTISLYRDWCFDVAIQSQPQLAELQSFEFQVFGYMLMGLGSLFVVTSMWRLGVTGTYLGDYFGILMDSPVTGFPFNTLDNPMYIGATLSFVGRAIACASPAGLLLCVVVYLVYRVALVVEEAHTRHVYALKAQKAQKSKKKRK